MVHGKTKGVNIMLAYGNNKISPFELLSEFRYTCPLWITRSRAPKNAQVCLK